MVMNKLLSPKELAEAIGVSESSLKRWADSGLIEYSRTVGGHRRITLGEAIRYIRETRTPVVRPEVLGIPDLNLFAQPPAPGTEADQLYKALVEGRAAEARALLLWLYLSGRGVAELLDGPLQEALARLGALWQHDEEGIFLEHRATDICLQALNQLRLTLPRSDDGPLAIGSAPAGDPYIIPSTAAALLLGSLGFRAVNLGPNTPFDTLRLAAENQRPRLVWLSVSYVEEPDAVQRGLALLEARLAELGIHLAVGGRQGHLVTADIGPRVFCGASMTELAAFARGLLAAQTTPNESKEPR